ncbi:SDR family NAD(P)-dependent oxidoreductase [Nocardioides sp.]|uniref:SDR family NAD(P)-dependent oxidoreductase n=1 Tax=Nocardioides sp. TaxID=35761 RepID=UPI003519CF71
MTLPVRSLPDPLGLATAAQALLITPTALARRVVRGATGAPSPLRGRTVLVTGASSGIGEATAEAVAARGARVVVVARRAAALAAVAGRIEAAGGEVVVHPADLTDPDAVDALVAGMEALGGVDYLVNNAGRSIRRSLVLSEDRFHDVERTMAINYLAPVRLTLGLLPGMRERGFGHVVNIVTWGVTLKAPKFSAYIASKAALDTWARIAARESYADGVTFTNMRFGLVRTPMVAPTEEYDGRPAMTSAQAARRVVRALEDRPVTWSVPLGVVGEIAGLVAPRTMDVVMHQLHRWTPDSAAARGEGRVPVPARG